jgi:hypothetical protein
MKKLEKLSKTNFKELGTSESAKVIGGVLPDCFPCRGALKSSEPFSSYSWLTGMHWDYNEDYEIADCEQG